MKKFIKKLLRESLRIPSDIELDNNYDYRSINYMDLELIEVGSYGDDIIYLGVKLPNEPTSNDGIVLDIKTEDGLYMIINILMAYNLQGLGLGYKIYKKFIEEFGHAFSNFSKRVNDKEVVAIWGKLENEPDFETYKTSNGELCVFASNPDKELIINKFINMYG